MPTGQRISNLLAVAIPFAAVLAAPVLLWGRWVGPWDLLVMAVLYAASGLGVTVGFHRLLTHRAFRTRKPLEYVFAILGSLAVQGTVIDWVADHRKHHAHADEDGDPHSPYEFGTGWLAALKGLWHAHVGWLLVHGHQADERKYARELVEDRGMVAVSRAFPLIVAAGLVIPAGIGYLVWGDLKGALIGLIWGGLVRVFLLHHVTFSINSVCHFFGRRRFPTPDRSTNVFWLALPSFGESWHNNHHAFPRSARHGLRWWEIDPSALLIKVMCRLRLAWDAVEISPERQRERAAAA